MSVYSDPTPNPVAAVVILAAGEGKRMKSSRSKLLHEIAGHSMLSYAVTAATAVQPEHIVVVVGHRRDQVEAHLAEIAPHVLIAVQEEQLGTGHAVQAALGQLADLNGDVIVTFVRETGCDQQKWKRQAQECEEQNLDGNRHRMTHDDPSSVVSRRR